VSFIRIINNFPAGEEMRKLNKRGVIGFVLTMAVGVAIGAAALVVGNEMSKKKKSSPKAQTIQKTNASSRMKPSSAKQIDKAFADYQKAYKDYQQAVGLGREDIQVYAENLRIAKSNLEWEILRNTPGSNELELKRKSQTTVEPEIVDYQEQDTESSVNPFAQDKSVTINSGQYQTTYSSDEETDSTSKEISEEDISSIEYYRVRKGDSLSNICERYYGDSGMWQHILKYQISSIAACPNLIFPGQIIALPRGFSKSRDYGSFPEKPQKLESDSSQKKYEVASSGGESWSNRFQKKYLISDRALTNYNTMSVREIQSFLDQKGSVLAKPYRGSTPAKMIYSAAKKYGINPQVLLTRLQCEQGLISAKAASKRKLDWALGVGAYDSGNWNQKYKGLDKQIEFAAATYRRHYDNARAQIASGKKVKMKIDGRNITVKNAATYAFYKYCPHFAGNKLFYDVWNGYKDSF
jgi:nucleoid-associated protein YgaU